MRLPKLLVFLIGIVAAGPALAGSPDDAAAAPSVVVLRGSSGPPTPQSPPPPPREVVVREVVYPPAFYLPLPFAIVRQHEHPAGAPAAAQFHRR